MKKDMLEQTMKPKLLLGLVLVLSGGLFCFHSGAQSISKTNEWRGFPILPPITNANPAIRNPISVRVPTQLTIERSSDMLSVTIDTNRMESTNLMVGANMVIGFRGREFVYPVGQSRPANGREELAGGLEFGSATGFYHTTPDSIPQAGRTYVVEVELELFETDIPPQHDWSPLSKNYKVLWQRTLKTSVNGDKPVANSQKQLDALESALNFVHTNQLNTAEYEMTAPEAIQRIPSESESAWRVSWQHKIPAGAAAIKGGQLVIVVHDSGKIEKVFSE